MSSKSLVPYDLAHNHFDAMKWDVGVQVMRLVAIFSITLWYNSLPLITFDYGFNTSLAKPNPCTNFSLNHNVYCQLRHSLTKFLNIKSHYSLSLVLDKIPILFFLLGHVWTPKTTINAFGWGFFATRMYYTWYYMLHQTTYTVILKMWFSTNSD